MSDTVSCLLVGIGGYGEAYMKPLLEDSRAGKLRLAGAVDPAPENCSLLGELRALDVPVYDCLESFYTEHTADLAVVSSPIQWHAHHVCTAVQNGSHVLCEKPLAATVQDGERMIQARDAAGRFVAVGYQWSFSAEIQHLKRDIREGLFGVPVRFKAMTLWPRTHAYYARNGWAGARRDQDGRWVLDSPVNNATAHYLHNMFYCLGDEWDTSARPLDAVGELYRANRITNYDTAALRCDTDAGAEVFYVCSHAVRDGDGPVFTFEFEEATVTFDGSDIVARAGGEQVKRYGKPDNGALRKLQQCMDAVQTGAQLACPIEAALSQTLAMNGLQESAPRIVQFPPALVHQVGEGGESRTVVDGLNETLRRCYTECALPTELGVEWVQAGSTVALTDYHHFPRTG